MFRAIFTKFKENFAKYEIKISHFAITRNKKFCNHPTPMSPSFSGHQLLHNCSSQFQILVAWGCQEAVLWIPCNVLYFPRKFLSGYGGISSLYLQIFCQACYHKIANKCFAFVLSYSSAGHLRHF